MDPEKAEAKAKEDPGVEMDSELLGVLDSQ
jgi:hypothetical protein